jgi:hypothetical protein
MREVRAIEYAKKFGKITNRIYQKLNRVGRDIAKYELGNLVEKGKLIQIGNGKQTYYVVANASGNFRGIYGVSKKHTLKSPQKLPDKTNATFYARFKPQKRNFRNGHLFGKNYVLQKFPKVPNRGPNRTYPK